MGNRNLAILLINKGADPKSAFEVILFYPRCSALQYVVLFYTFSTDDLFDLTSSATIIHTYIHLHT